MKLRFIEPKKATGKYRQVGRPEAKDPVKSHTVCLRLTEAGKLKKKYKTLTNAIKTLL